ncbi:hypothetical protein RhiirA4_540511 [Rhizophagus irregularis]|uniref:Uncharacterized protein n=1 Tax=Rhizophagus irregularis TaxID=588596 RepID=A0A2I1G7H7_9GLOM|nr:hypothetical protein RhiirA4_540511 [Rhizophagus irregularis]
MGQQKFIDTSNYQYIEYRFRGIDNYNFASLQLWSSPCPICNRKHGNYGLHGKWYCENGNQLPYDPELAKFYSQDKLEYCLTCNTSSNKLKFAIDCANSKDSTAYKELEGALLGRTTLKNGIYLGDGSIDDSTAYKELEGALLRQNYFEKWHIFRGWKHGCKVCEECDHLYCKRCKKVAEGIYKRCECPQLDKSMRSNIIVIVTFITGTSNNLFSNFLVHSQKLCITP